MSKEDNGAAIENDARIKRAASGNAHKPPNPMAPGVPPGMDINMNPFGLGGYMAASPYGDYGAQPKSRINQEGQGYAAGSAYKGYNQEPNVPIGPAHGYYAPPQFNMVPHFAQFEVGRIFGRFENFIKNLPSCVLETIKEEYGDINDWTNKVKAILQYCHSDDIDALPFDEEKYIKEMRDYSIKRRNLGELIGSMENYIESKYSEEDNSDFSILIKGIHDFIVSVTRPNIISYI
jgi:hypothetical protein